MRTARPIRSSILAACVLLAAGCAAPMSAEQCASADWYRLGYRDGDVYGLQAQIVQYAEQCRSASVDRKAYMAGWSDGYAEFRSRVEKTESP
jgi:hypothetical protein